MYKVEQPIAVWSMQNTARWLYVEIVSSSFFLTGPPFVRESWCKRLLGSVYFEIVIFLFYFQIVVDIVFQKESVYLHGKFHLIVLRPVVTRYQSALDKDYEWCIKSKKDYPYLQYVPWNSVTRYTLALTLQFKTFICCCDNRSSEAHINQEPGVFEITDNQSHIRSWPFCLNYKISWC